MQVTSCCLNPQSGKVRLRENSAQFCVIDINLNCDRRARRRSFATESELGRISTRQLSLVSPPNPSNPYALRHWRHLISTDHVRALLSVIT